MIKQYKKKYPTIASSCFVAENASIIGDVQVQEDSSIWFHTVIRGDSDEIRIGAYTNIQDNCTLHTDTGHKLIIEDRVTIGHNAIIHGAYIEEECLIGMGAIVLNGAHIGKHSIIGAGALIREHQIIPENSVVVGCPGNVVKQTTPEQVQDILNNAQHYAELGKEYKEE
ncbi:gamma carbonic anhydrase family protein [Amedibacillus sp. YH-ame6]